MNTLVIYDSQFGNTERIAQAIASMLSEFGQARAIRVDPTHPVDFQGVDLLILGCPTQGWKPTPAMQTFLGNVSPKSLRGLAVACFDTRFDKPRWMTGSAARVMDKKLRAMGVLPALPPESFFVAGTEGPLASGELERAAKWARMLREKIEAPHLAVR
jgi:flavodoxin